MVVFALVFMLAPHVGARIETHKRRKGMVGYASQLIAQKHECASRRVRELIDLDLQETLTFRSVL